MKKRLFSIVLSVAMLLGLLPVSVFAADSASMSASKASDGTISVVVTVAPTADGITSYALAVQYDSSLVDVDTSKGTPLGLIISLADKNGVSQTTNCLINAAWAASPSQSVYARSVCYATSYSTSQTTSYPSYSSGRFNLYRSLRAGWTYNYCIIYWCDVRHHGPQALFPHRL